VERSRGWCSTPLRRSAFAFAALLLALIGATIFRPPVTSGPFARDFEAYYAAGATWNAGGDPYSRDVWRVERTIPGVDATHDELLPFIGPAASLPLWSLLARLPFDAARTVWLALLALALAVLAVAAARLAAGRLTFANAGLALLLGVVSGPLIGAFALGQVALAGAAAMAVALLALERTSLWAIPAVVLAAIQPNLTLPLIARADGRRRIVLLAVAALIFLALTFAAGGGPGGFVGYLRHLSAHGASERFSLNQYTVTAIATSFQLAPGLAIIAGAVALFIAVGSVIASAIAFRARSGDLVIITIALLPFGIPFFHEHDFAIELIPAIVLAASSNLRVRMLAGFGAACVLVDWLGVAQRPDVALQTGCFALAVTCAYAALAGNDAARSTPLWRVPVAGTLLALLLVPLAFHVPAPVWPDALGAFHAAAGLDASGVWAAEQQRAGLTATAPAWGLLRTVPLFGCLLFAIAAIYSITMRSPRSASAMAVSDSPSHGPATQ
jgi:hypothetical protein